jgi:hypothetical protein
LFRQPLPERQLIVPHGHLLTFVVGQFQPGWVCRHLTVRGPHNWPTMAHVRVLMDLFGFSNTLEACLTWAEGPHDRRSVHVLEPVSGDWSPLRSS